MNKKSVLSLVAMVGLAWSGMASAQTAPIDVTATVAAKCTITAGNLAFGTYDPFLGTPQDQDATVTVNCTKGTSIDVGLDTGSNGGNASGTTRAMTDGANFLEYELYTDAGHSAVWGDTKGTDTVAYSSPGMGDHAITVYGRIPAGQDPGAGAYTDTITATVLF